MYLNENGAVKANLHMSFLCLNMQVILFMVQKSGDHQLRLVVYHSVSPYLRRVVL